MSAAPTFDVLFAKVSPEPNSGCWLWLGTISSIGYGQYATELKPGALAHRLMYEAIKGPIPADKQLDHLCRVRCCVNPDHLEPVTARENCLRGHSIQAANARKTHCPYGHVYSQRQSETRRRCRKCDCIASRKHRLKLKVERTHARP